MDQYQQRTYRNQLYHSGLSAFNVTFHETDLYVLADSIIFKDVVCQSILKFRQCIESFIIKHPDFLTSFEPLYVNDDYLLPDIIVDMLNAGRFAGVGPMASVAGAIAEYVAKDILQTGSKNIVIENGGDIYLKTESDMIISIFAGTSPLSQKVKILIKPERMPLGVCTSSGTVGHSVSFGNADAVCVLSHSATIADAAATAIGNQVRDKNDIRKALDFGLSIKNVLGVLIILDNTIAVQGDVELT
jgi:ApbE superfamily uncharacterized protein (UPF0280 family)